MIWHNETQIMWNGILGEISLRAKDAVFMKDIQIYPDIQTREIHVKGKLQNTGNKASGTLTVHVKEKNTGKSVTEIEQQMDLSAGGNNAGLCLSHGRGRTALE